MDQNNRIDNFLIIDVETGGKIAKKHQVIEFAAIWVESTNFKEIDRYSSLILPYGKYGITQEALDANGIKIEEIAEEGKELDQVVKIIIEKTIKCNKSKMKGKKTIVVAQNALFDIGFLQQMFKETKQDLSKILTGSTDFFGNFQPVYMDTLFLGRSKYANDESKVSFSLSSLCQYENVDLINAHRAMADVESTLELLKKYISAIRDGQSGALYDPRKNFKFQL